jgi:hypothetical protein
VTATEVAEVDGGETDVEVEVDVGGAVVLWLLEQAGTKTKVATSTTEAVAMDRQGNEARIRTFSAAASALTRAFGNFWAAPACGPSIYLLTVGCRRSRD